ncbi:DNA polymerase III subunit gamma/tau [Paenibacillus polymyxa]|uniref:DNA polymerase III subunit gamma/tau n=1 Tax=Paenibacillus polymyxa TaxID=1406 RepID=UPI001BE85215|nr:DNA polymerase III subunit gamma/tau [Paenibacillus polymyxa]MBT2286070.1 DNA polymerase III subunit gamma/tau [Paenibacillus polymyxa]
MTKRMETNSFEFSALRTAYCDLSGIISLLQFIGNKKFTAVPVFPIARDVCLVLYQINKEILGSSYELNTEIKKIRHKVKLNSSNNLKMHEEILAFHVEKYGDDVNNLGFYLEDGNLIGSTLYPTYLYYDTTFFKNDNIATEIFSFFRDIGNISTKFLQHISNLSQGKLKFEIPKPMILADDLGYSEKDIHHTSLFTGDKKKNALITRLLLIQQELVTCIWLKDNISAENVLALNNAGYILLRLLTMKIDQVMDNLKNIQKYLPDYFLELNHKCKSKLLDLMNAYEESISEECRTLRNMLHYSSTEVNLYDYLEQRSCKNDKYISLMVDEIVLNFAKPLSVMLSEYFNIANLQSMSDMDMILNRLKSKGFS